MRDQRPGRRIPSIMRSRAALGAAERSALRVAGLFALFGSLWILLSDRVVERGWMLGYHPATLQTAKGIVFVVLSAVLIFEVARRAYRALAASEQRRAEAQRISHTGDWQLDARTGEVVWSDELYRIFGLDPRRTRVDVDTFRDAVHPDDRALVAEVVQGALADGEPYQVEHRIVRPDGSIRYVHARGEVWRRPDGTVGGLLGSVHDMTERREAEERFRLMVEGSEEVFFFEHDSAGRFTYLSPSVSRVLGYEPETLLGRPYHVLLMDEYEPSSDLTALALATGERQPAYRLAVSHASGRRLVLEIVERPIQTGPDSRGLQGLARDVTDRESSDVMLRRRLEVEAALARISSHLATGKADAADRVVAEVGRLLGVDCASIHLLLGDTKRLERGYEWCAPGVELPTSEPEEPGPWQLAELEEGSEIRIEDVAQLPPDTVERVRLEARGIRSAVAMPLTGQDGTLGFIALYGLSPRRWLDEDVQTLRVVGRMTATELERHRAEERLRLLSRAVDQSPASIVMTDPSGDIVYVNPKFSAVTGYARDEVLGRNPRLLQSGHQSAAFYRDMWKTITSGREWRGEIQNRRKDGQLFWEVAAISPVLSSSGEITHYVAVKEDVTESRLLQRKFEQVQKMDAVGRLAGGLAHDFNNVLTAIRGHADLVLDRLPSDDARRADMEEIVNASDRAAGVIRQLLHFSSQGGTHPAVVELGEVARELHRMLDRLLGDEVVLEVDVPAEPCPIHADRGQIEQVLINLAINARDAMPDGGALRITVERVDVEDDPESDRAELRAGDSVRVTVADTGSGMSEEVQRHVFEPFFTTKEPGKGSGLGLATAFGMVQQNRGHIGFRSEDGRGTTFTLHFPALPSPALAVASGASAERGGVPQGGGDEVVLVVEDEPAVRAVVRRVLLRLGYTVLEAGDGPEAERTSAAHGGPIHLLLTDVVMPGIRGPEVARRLRSARPELGVILMSGHTFDEAADPASLVDGAFFLAKPFTAEVLAATVRAAIDGVPGDSPAGKPR